MSQGRERMKPYSLERPADATVFGSRFSDVTRRGVGVSCCLVTTDEAIRLLEDFRAGKISAGRALRAFQAAPVANLGFARVDTHRALRKGFPEVIYAAGKTAQQVVDIAAHLAARERRVLITRVSPEQARLVRRRFKRAVYHEAARCVTLEKTPLPKRPGLIAVLCAGTSDLPVAEEAAVTADIMGNRVERIYDVGVAGLHRLLGRLETMQTRPCAGGGGGDGRGAAERGGGVGQPPGHRGADERGLRREFWRAGRACWGCSTVAAAASRW